MRLIERSNLLRMSATIAEWLIALLRDQANRLLISDDCKDIDSIVTAVHAQWQPVEEQSRGLLIRALQKNLEDAQHALKAEEFPDSFGTAQSLLKQAQNAQSFSERRTLLRHAIFDLRQGLRSLKKSGILE
jgi:hypothetical protein